MMRCAPAVRSVTVPCISRSCGGINALVFTGGVGEHLAQIRAAATANFAVMGLTIGAEANARAVPAADISKPRKAARHNTGGCEADESAARQM